MQEPAFRHTSLAVPVGSVIIGGGAPIVVQSMTNTCTADIEATAQQTFALYQAGSELVRLTVNDMAAAEAIPHIRDRLVTLGWADPLLIGDFHYNGHQLLTQVPACAVALAKYRINPGNVGFGNKHDKNFATMIEVALRENKPVRIGVNWGSLDQGLLASLLDTNLQRTHPLPLSKVTEQALVESALQSALQAEKIGLPANKIVLSCKTSELPILIRVYQALAQRSNYALHLGLTEAGMDTKGIVATSAALGILLYQGIGDTIRASLTPPPGGDRAQEVRVCQEILQSLALRAFAPAVTACPGCGRTTSQVFQQLAQTIQQHIQAQMPTWKKHHPGVENLKIAVMGCVVNGPGESKNAHIGISLPGTGELPAAPVFIDGEKYTTLRGEGIAQAFIAIVESYIAERFPNNKY